MIPEQQSEMLENLNRAKQALRAHLQMQDVPSKPAPGRKAPASIDRKLK